MGDSKNASDCFIISAQNQIECPQSGPLGGWVQKKLFAIMAQSKCFLLFFSVHMSRKYEHCH
jgi:hypothetical protein